MEDIESMRMRYLTVLTQLNNERTAREAAELQILNLQDELQTTKAKHEHEVQELRAEIEVFEAERAYTVDLRERFKQAREKAKESAESNERLKEELTFKQPLYQVGKDIRRRFLEQAREPSWAWTRDILIRPRLSEAMCRHTKPTAK